MQGHEAHEAHSLLFKFFVSIQILTYRQYNYS